MNIRDLKYLTALAYHNHFGKAAEACFVSQPGLSMQIKKLEDSLGITLIERSNKRFYFTEAGKHIAEQARELLLSIDNLKETAQQWKDPLMGDVQLGIIPTLAPYLLPRIMPGLSNAFPKLKLYLTETTTDNLLNKINEGTLDAGLLVQPLSEDFIAQPLFDEELLLAVSPRHILAKRAFIKNHDLKDKNILLLEDGHCLRDQTLDICLKANVSESRFFRATSLETLRYMVANDVGITLMPQLSCRSDDGLVYIPLASKPERKICMVWRKSSAKNVLFEQMVDHIRMQAADF